MTKQDKSALNELLKFLDRSPTAWHAVENVETELKKAGFHQLQESETWTVKPGGKYYAIRNGSSLCAFVMPKKEIQSARIVAGHTDSPGFKLKPNAEFRKENMVMLGVEVYGGPLITSWLNRDLGIAGRVAFLDSHGTIQQTLVRLDKHPVVIPQLAIHLDRKVNEEGLLLNKQEQLAAIAALSNETEKAKSYLEVCLKEQFSFKELLSYDLFLFPLEPAAFVGFQQQMIAAYRIDSLMSVHGIVKAMCQADAVPNELKVVTLCDNEEIGSETAQGAASPFLLQILERITIASAMSREDYLRLLRHSLCVSVDLAHAVHPNYSDRHEPRHPIKMQHGIAVKYNAQHRYASDALSAAPIIALCKKHNIPVQQFVARGDIAAGTTIGPIYAHTTGIPTVDIGSPQLSMHSCRELSSCQDYLDMATLLKECLKAKN